MNFTYKDFWKLVATNKKYKELVEEQGFDRYPEWGVGSKGGGRICLCDFCGHIKYVHNPTQNFCCRKCRYDFNHSDVIPNPLPRRPSAKRRLKVHRICGYCGERFSVNAHRVRAGGGIYCSKDCAHKATALKAIWFVCNTCGMEFRAVSDETCRFCSIECTAEKPRFTADGLYNESKPKLVDKYDIIDHRVNAIIKSIQQENPKIKMSPTMRNMILTKKHHEKLDNYYLTPAQRKLFADLKMLIDENYGDEAIND
jgi:hypothetical protein